MKKILFNILWVVTIMSSVSLPQLCYNHDPLAHTFSIVARDPETGEMGVAVQSH